MDKKEWRFTEVKKHTFVVPTDGIYNIKCIGAAGGGITGGLGPAIQGKWYHNSSGCTYNGETHTTTTTDKCSYCGHSCGGLSVAPSPGKKLGSLIGKGASVEGKIFLKRGAVLDIYVGGKGEALIGGFNGGGNGSGTKSKPGFGGGGASDVRLNGDSLSKRIIVAGGGGGTDASNNNTEAGYLNEKNDGSGGHATVPGSYDLDECNPRIDGAATRGYSATLVSGYALGQGETPNIGEDSGGGGGGYYGGRATNHNSGGGGGGSSYASDNFIDITYTIGVSEGDGSVIISIEAPVNFEHYAYEVNGKFIIPTASYYDMYSDKFREFGKTEMLNFDSNVHFIRDISELGKPFIFNNKLIKPHDILKNEEVKIAKFSGYKYQANKNIKPKDASKVEYKIKLNEEVYKHSLIKVKETINIPLSEYKYSLTLNQSDVFKVGIKRDIHIYGKDDEIIAENEIYKKGYNASDLIKLETELRNVKFIFAFSKETNSDEDEIRNITITKSSNSIRGLIPRSSYIVTHNTENDRVYIKFLDIYKNIYVTKLKKDDQHVIINTIDTF